MTGVIERAGGKRNRLAKSDVALDGLTEADDEKRRDPAAGGLNGEGAAGVHGLGHVNALRRNQRRGGNHGEQG